MREKPRAFSLSRQAFTLGEVVLAVAVVSFALIGMLGVFSAGINADISSSRSTAIANMAQQVTSDLRGNTNWTAAVGPNDFYSTDYYFDDRGNPLSSATASTAYYDCHVSLSDTNQPPPGASSAPNFLSGTLNFTWPHSVNLSHPFSTNIYTSVRL